MALTSAQLGDTDVVDVRIDGPVRAEDMEMLRELVEAVVSTRGGANLLVEYVDPGAIGPKTLWDDVRLARSLHGIGKVAIVAESSWSDRLASAEDRLVSADVETFGPGERDQAEQWLLGGLRAREREAADPASRGPVVGGPDGP